jgi:hypothetical protein
LGRRRNEYNTKEDVGELCQDLLHWWALVLAVSVVSVTSS